MRKKGDKIYCCGNLMATMFRDLAVGDLIKTDVYDFSGSCLDGHKPTVGTYIPSCPTCNSNKWSIKN